MSITSLSQAQLRSSAYLNELAAANQQLVLQDSCLHLVAESNIASHTTTLVITADALCLEQLHLVQQQLADVATLHGVTLATSAYFPGRAVATCYAEVIQPDLLPERVDQLCSALQLEIADVSKAPSLSQPGLLVMDMDSTVIDVECIDELAKLAGAGDEVAKVTEAAMQGELDFEQSLRQRVGCLKGLSLNALDQVRLALPLNPGIAHLVSVLQQHNWRLAIASGGFTYFAEYLQQRLGLDEAFANVLAMDEEALLGDVVGDVVDAQTKADVLKRLAKQYNISPSQTVAMGDGANDLVMMEAAAFGVAYHAKPVVRQKADCSIRFTGLDALLSYLR